MRTFIPDLPVFGIHTEPGSLPVFAFRGRSIDGPRPQIGPFRIEERIPCPGATPIDRTEVTDDVFSSPIHRREAVAHPQDAPDPQGIHVLQMLGGQRSFSWRMKKQDL